MFGRLHHVVIDCPDPPALAAFYSPLVGWPVVWDDPDWTVLAADRTSSGLAFQRAPELRPPRWPDPEYPQQYHVDIMVDDIVAAAGWARAHGATALEVEPDGWGVYADPAGHPFCLLRRPAWAPPVDQG
jgi:catechol 2,3-dioxygenase-like lactoylglutathione lyase family enzyme